MRQLGDCVPGLGSFVLLGGVDGSRACCSGDVCFYAELFYGLTSLLGVHLTGPVGLDHLSCHDVHASVQCFVSICTWSL